MLPVLYHEYDEEAVATELSAMWSRFFSRWTERNTRMSRIVRVVTGDWGIKAEDDMPLDNGTPNLIQVAMEDTAESASLAPTVRGTPTKQTAGAKDAALTMEKLGQSYLESSEIHLLNINTLLNLCAYGMFAWVLVNDPRRGPRIEWRDARTCYPEPDFSSLGTTSKCFFARDLFVTQMPPEWEAKMRDHYDVRYGSRGSVSMTKIIDQTVTLVEYYDNSCTIVAAVYDAGRQPYALTALRSEQSPTHVSVILEVQENKIGVCPVVIGQRPTIDGEPRGQFDQVIDVLRAHARLQGLVLDYSDQMVYADTWFKDVIGDLPTGGGGLIELGPNGAIGRVPPATSSLSVYNEMAQLLDAVHLGGRWPKSRMGDIDQAIASAKFIESTVGVMNQVIRTCHLILKPAMERALTIMAQMDKTYGPETRSVNGIHKNQQYVVDRKRSEIDMSVVYRVEYGLGLGRDPAQSMVLGIQAAQSEIVSWEFVQENIEGITDVALERSRIDTQKFRELLLAQLAMDAQQGALPPASLIMMMEDREKGKSLTEVYKKHVLKPKEEQQEQMLTSGLTGGSMMPGMPPAPGGMAPPGAPSPEDLFGGLLGGGEPPESIGRLSTPAGGPGSFAGTQSSS